MSTYLRNLVKITDNLHMDQKRYMMIWFNDLIQFRIMTFLLILKLLSIQKLNLKLTILFIEESPSMIRIRMHYKSLLVYNLRLKINLLKI